MTKRNYLALGAAGILAAAILISAVALGSPVKANAATISEIENQIGVLEDQQSVIAGQIADLEAQLKDNYTEIEETLQQKALIDQQIFLIYEEIININEQIVSYNVLIADKQDELDEATKHHDELKAAYKERIRAMEEDGTISYWSVLFKSESFADFLDRMNMIEEIAASDHRRLMELQDAADAVAAAQAALAAEKDAVEATRTELDAAQQELLEKQTQTDALLEELRAKGDEYLEHLEEAELRQSAKMQELAQQNQALAEMMHQQWLSTSVPDPTTKPTQPPATQATQPEGTTDTTEPTEATEPEETTEPTEPEETTEPTEPEEESGSSGEGWLTPVSGYYISSPFGPRTNPFSGQEQWHEGIDMVCAGGTPIYATRSGYVTSASYNDSCGYYVYLSHDGGYGSIYMHMTHYVVGYGEYVSQGQVIGYVGSTGESEVEHLHFGISYDGYYVNPMDYI